MFMCLGYLSLKSQIMEQNHGGIHSVCVNKMKPEPSFASSM